MKASLLVFGLMLCTGVTALDAKWTPNGEAPAPFSTRARQQMGVDPQQFADGSVAGAPPGGGFKLTLWMLGVMYVANNWNAVLALQAILLKLLDPLLRSLKAQGESRERARAAAEAERARVARRDRLRSSIE